MSGDVLDQAGRLSAAGRRQEAVALVESAAAGDDAEALFALANWRLFGLFGPRDLAAAHGFLDRAVAAGSVEAVRAKAALIGNGTGAPPDLASAERLLETIRGRDAQAAAQLDLLGRMRDAGRYKPASAVTVSTAPLVMRYPDLLSAEECGYLIRTAEPQLRPSFVRDPQSGRQMPHPIRTSTGMSFGPTQEDLVVRRLNKRIAAASGTEVACGEPLHILRYAVGQEYRPHTDAVPGEANARAWTVLVYLNDDFEGGATVFPQAGVEVRAVTGSALIFRNVDEAGRPDPATLHAGRAVTRGVKWLATRWIRAAPHDPWTA